MERYFTRLSITALTLLALSLPGFAGQLDDYYLSQFAEQSAGTALQKAVLFQSADASETPHCGTPLKHGLKRDWNKLEATTQKTLAKQLALPTLSDETTVLSSGGHFIIHYATTSSPKVCQNKNSSNYGQTFDDVPTPQAPYTLQSWVQAVGDSFEYAYNFYRGMGYSLPPNFPATQYNVYLSSLVCDSEYGVTTSIQSAKSTNFPYAYTSFIEIDKDFTNSLYKPQTYTPLQSLQITSAHEFHHAIQYGYNIFFDIWYAEATSTWYEDEVYDAVNQLYNYVPGWFNNSTLPLDTTTSTTTGGGYGRWIFNRYLAERYGTSVIRNAWEKLATLNSPDGQSDIPMVPVLENLLTSAPFSSTLGSEYFGFTKRIYTRDWTSHAYEVTATRPHPYTPQAAYVSFPVSAVSVTLPHYSFAFYKFVPSTVFPNLTIYVDPTSGIQATVFINDSNGITEIPRNPGGMSFTVNGFGSLNAATDEVVLLVVNTTNVDNHMAAFSTDGSLTSITEPSNVPVSNLSPTAAAGTGGGGGCFIATAAYGSYLHPQVQVLRDFRDHYLLTNVPGRSFVALYYRLSPPMADFIAGHELLRGVTRVALTPLIVAAAHPALAGTTILLAGGLLLYRPLRRRFQACATHI